MQRMTYVLDSIRAILTRNDSLSAYSAVRILLSDLRKISEENNDCYPGINDINEKIMIIETHLLSYLGINSEIGFNDEQVHALVNNALSGIKDILARDAYKL
ncbi:hypothetical protein CWO33_23435 [Vibrio splendidus]|uniref:hypothetical protein n=1 Tax=Vibrio splendidus TaxID=29497 RepID=UPI000D356627|nr:hypothetical protein [Vibrio splendidus]PTQ05437.1 hypothetical protein CWO33_23435 [Vibrio splendidus]